MEMEIRITTEKNVIVLTKEQYDLFREKASVLNQVCDVQRRKIKGEYKYDWDYIADMGHLLDDLVISDVPEAMRIAKEEANE